MLWYFPAEIMCVTSCIDLRYTQTEGVYEYGSNRRDSERDGPKGCAQNQLHGPECACKDYSGTIIWLL